MNIRAARVVRWMGTPPTNCGRSEWARLKIMKKLLALLGLALAFAASLPAQDPAPSPAPARTPEQIDQLLGPIALYPDALIALILPASTASADIVLASRYFQAGSDPADVENQPWDDSVRSLAHYPEIVKWMDQNLAWTKQVGDVFAAQPVDVMQSVQRLRAAARAAGTLVDTPQQQVVYQGEAISIVPAQPDVIYVPYYDPDVVYVARSEYNNNYPYPYLTFGVGFSVGSWLSFDLDWGNHRVWFISRENRERYWLEHRDWRHPAFPGRPTYVRDPDRHPWRPTADYSRSTQADVRRMRTEVVRPSPLPSAPPRLSVRHDDPTPGRPDYRDRPAAQPDEHNRDRSTPPARPVVNGAPTAPAPTERVVQPSTPPPDPRFDNQPRRNDSRQPDHRDREGQPNPAARQPVAAPAQAEHTALAPRQGPQAAAASQPPEHARTAAPAPAPAAAPAATPAPNQNQPQSDDNNNRRPERGSNGRAQPQ